MSVRTIRQALKALIPPPVFPMVRSAHHFACGALYKLLPNDRLTPWQRFIRDGHDTLLVRDLQLTPDSTVLDFGGYVGDYSAALAQRYGCRIHVFEPMHGFADQLRRRFSRESRVTIHECGIASQRENRVLHISQDATGAFASGEPHQVVFEAVDCLDVWTPGVIDLIHINIEGGEYELIPCLDNAGVLARAKRVIVQFHRTGPAPEESRQQCERILAKHYHTLWDYDWLWQAWRRKDLAVPEDDAL